MPGENIKTTCPQCSPTRRHKSDPCLSINLETGAFHCHHCGYSGTEDKKRSPRPLAARQTQSFSKEVPRVGPEVDRGSQGKFGGFEWKPLPESCKEWLSARGIPESVVERNRLMCGRLGNKLAVVFPYYRDGELVNAKYRTKDKRFRMEPGRELIPYGLDDIKGQKEALVCEGECFPGDAEVLGPEGWIRLDRYSGGPVLAVNGDLSASFVHPSAIVRKEYRGDLLRVERGGNYVTMTTPGHNLVYRVGGEIRKRPIEEMPRTVVGCIPTCVVVDGAGIPLSRDQIMLALAVSADASIRSPEQGYRKRYAVFGLKKQRKIRRLRGVLTRLGIQHSDNEIAGGYTSICFHIPDFVPGRLLPWDWVMKASLTQREFILSEMVLWGGNRVNGRAQTEYSSKHEQNAAWMQAMAHTAGRMSTVMRRSNKFGQWFKTSILHKKSSVSWQSIVPERVPFNGVVHCVTVPSGMLLVRQEGKITVTGNCDKLALETAGFKNCISVPNGAPNINERDVTKRYEPLLAASAWIDPLEKIILAVDADAPGKRLEEELARRLGKHRCWRVTWPDGCKDANDVLLNFGPDRLKMCIQQAEQYPIAGIITVDDMASGIANLFKLGLPPGESPGWASLAKYFTVRPGRLTIVTGYVSHGKSAFVEQVLCNLAVGSYWRHAVYSPEHHPLELHFWRIAAKLTGKTVRLYHGHPQFAENEIEAVKLLVKEHFVWIEPEEETPTLDRLLELATALVIRKGIRTLTIDPWNEIDHERPQWCTETEYVSRCLSKIKKWARKYEVHVFLVAHPAKPFRDRNGRYPVPTPYDISGCYSADTEVLTLGGWKPHAEITTSDHVACFDPDKGELRYERPTEVWSYSYTGPMYRLKTISSDVLVTPNHTIFVKPCWGKHHKMVGSGLGRPQKYSRSEWTKIRADEINGELLLPWAHPFRMNGPGPAMIWGYPAEGLLRFIGWWIAEGHLCKVSGGLGVCQAVGPMAEKMRSEMLKCGIDFTESISPPGKKGIRHMWVAYVGVRKNRELCSLIPKFCGVGAKNKRIPSFVWLCSVRQKVLLLQSLLEGDGSTKGKDNYQYSTISKQLADDVQRLAIECGRMASVAFSPSTVPGHQDRYSVVIGRRKRHTIGLYKRRHVSVEQYDGNVYCLTVPTGAYLVRRNGKPGIYGNSSNFRNKADNCITVYRDLTGDRSNIVQIHVQKVKWQAEGKIGMVELEYEPATERYKEIRRC